MKYTLKNKLTLSYILISIIIIGLISYFVNYTIEKEFKNYVINRQVSMTNEIIEEVQDLYSQEYGYDLHLLESIGMRTLEEGLIITILDTNNNVIWSAMEHNSGLCESMISNVRENMYSYYTDWNGEYEVKDFSLIKNDQKIGILETGYIGPYYFKDDELLFLKAINKILFYITLGSFLIAIFIGVIMARSITNPLSKVIHRLNLMEKGRAAKKSFIKTNIKEIELLSTTIDNLESRLTKQEILRKHLTQDIAHELRTPLTSVQGHMEAMIDGIWELSTERLSSCYEEIMRIKCLISRIEDLARVEHANLLLNKTKFDIRELIQDIIYSFDKKIKENQITVNLDSSPTYIHADKEKLRQVFNNLFTNSIQYAGKRIIINIKIKTTLDKIIINFSDNGIGIEQEYIDYIFERFYRIKQPKTSLDQGLGIGLTISKAIITAHKGTIDVISKKRNGTLFIIELPK